MWWPAVCIPETSSGLLGKVDGEKGRYRLYEEGALWHCVFINRGNKRYPNLLKFTILCYFANSDIG